jgi:hypothetical protein
MRNKETFTKEELQHFKHEDVDDEIILHLFCTCFNTTVFQALNSANVKTLGWTNDTHIRNLSFELMTTGRISKPFRKYFIDCLCGNDIFYTNTERTEALLLA